MRWASHRFVVAFQRSNFGKMLCGRRRRQVDFYFWQSGQVDGQVSFVVGVIFCVPFDRRSTGLRSLNKLKGRMNRYVVTRIFNLFFFFYISFAVRPLSEL